MQKVNINEMFSTNSRRKAFEKADIISMKGRFKQAPMIRTRSYRISTQRDRPLPTLVDGAFVGGAIVFLLMVLYASFAIPIIIN